MAKKLIGNQSRIDMNKNGRIDAEDFKILRSSMNGAYRNERKHVNHNEDYEIRYAKPRPKRTGYKGKRAFDDGGTIDAFTIRVVKGTSGKPNEIISDPQEIRFRKGGSVKNERLHVNHSEDYEVRYAKPRPSRKGYKDTRKFVDGGKVSFKEKARAYADGREIRVGDLLKKRGRSISVKVVDVGNDWRSGYDTITIYNDVTNTTTTLVDWSDYEKVEYSKMATGGKVSFKEKARAIAKKFEGKRVEPKYQKEYGKVYSKAEAKEVGNKIAGSQKAKYDAKAEKGAVVKKGKGNHKMKATTELARKIRRDGEKWTDAIKRASEQIKNK